jgi:acetyl-CoA carboxylase / biotin carboxylase 1
VKMAAREEQLLPVYLQIALQFADLHDRAGRMEAKGTIRQPLRWKDARRFFYWRLRRRLSEELILKRMTAAVPTPAPRNGSGGGAIPANGSSSGPQSIPAREAHLRTLQSWSELLDGDFERNDYKVATWYEENKKTINAKIEALKIEGLASEVAQLLMGNKEAGLKGVQQVLGMLPVEEKESVLKYLAS